MVATMAHSLVDLPTEILDAIISKLCIHCDDPQATTLPLFDTALGRANKGSLSRVCLTSKRLCDIAQPILFHYFNINNTGTISTKRLQSQPSQFIRTIYLKPSLGQAVRAISLSVTTDDGADGSDTYPIERETWELLRQSGFWNWINVSSLEQVHIALGILKSTPNVEYLQLSVREYYKIGHWNNFLDTLPRMRVLELHAPPGRNHSMYGLTNVFPMLPNLETFHAFSTNPMCEHYYKCHSTSSGPCDQRPWELLPPKISKIVFDFVDIFRLRHIFHNCSHLEDLEMFIVNARGGSKASPPNGALEMTRGKLRRLVVSMQSWFAWVGEPGAFEARTAPGGQYYRLNMAFRYMTALEILGVDQCVLHADVMHAADSNASELSAALPESLRKLHIGYVVSWEHLEPQLLDLALQKNTGRFNSLTRVRIDPYIPVPNACIEQMRTAMAKAGVVFIVGSNPPGPQGYSRQMVYPCPIPYCYYLSDEDD